MTDQIETAAEALTTAEGWDAARALAAQVVEDGLGSLATREMALRVLGDGMPEPPELRVEYRDSYAIVHEAACPDGEKIPDRGECRRCGALLVKRATTEYRWRNGEPVSEL